MKTCVAVGIAGLLVLFPASQGYAQVTFDFKEDERGYTIILPRKEAENLRDALNEHLDEEKVASILATVADRARIPLPAKVAARIIIELWRHNTTQLKKELTQKIGKNGVIIHVGKGPFIDLDKGRVSGPSLDDLEKLQKWVKLTGPTPGLPIGGGLKLWVRLLGGETAEKVTMRTPLTTPINPGDWRIESRH
jgi:hypothetical protein